MIEPNLPKSENFNSCGFIFEEKFFLSGEYGNKCLKLNEIKSIKLVNIRDLKVNLLIIVISIALIYFSFLYFDFSLIYKIVLLATILPFLIIAFFYKKYHHKLIVITKNYHLILTKVNSNSKRQVEEIVIKINDKL